ncbi:MAG: ATP-binding protein [Alicyclobacillaceae bacterium]|nr:ATP-binding protein [Alicyclobacillaceae bacterium]
MIGTCLGAVLDGIESVVVQVEADVGAGIPHFTIVGLPDSAVSESKLRIRSAIRNSGWRFPSKRITVNLSPAGLRKRGAGLDLAIAVAILRADGQLPPLANPVVACCAKLSLSGQLVPVPAMVNLALALRGRADRVAVSIDQRCVDLPGLAWHPFATLAEAARALSSANTLPAPVLRLPPPAADSTAPPEAADFAEVEGLEEVKRALTIAAAGRHHVLLIGPPGCGKTMAAERFPTLLPRLTPEQALQVYAIRQAAGLPDAPTLIPPLRSPHHTLTVPGMIGGTAQLTPGEVTLAHHGVLLLDELLEFRRTTLESLREPLVHHCVRLTRGGRTTTLPANFILLGTLNPCPCGRRGFGECRCGDAEVSRYWSRLSGPLLDRIDLVVTIQPRTQHPRTPLREDSNAMRMRVEHAVRRAQKPVPWSHASAQLLRRAVDGLHLSRRAADSVRRVAETICTLSEFEEVRPEHVHEALGLRGQLHMSTAPRR